MTPGQPRHWLCFSHWSTTNAYSHWESDICWSWKIKDSTCKYLEEMDDTVSVPPKEGICTSMPNWVSPMASLMGSDRRLRSAGVARQVYALVTKESTPQFPPTTHAKNNSAEHEAASFIQSSSTLRHYKPSFIH